MLGEQIGETRGKVTGTRVLPGDDYRYMKVETTVEESGTMLGMEVGGVATYVAWERIPGQMYGEGQGVLGAGEEGAIFNGHGIGRMTGPDMSVSFRVSFAFQASTTGKLARLNEVLVLAEHEADGDGNTHTTFWEWK
jgi:hypothetical protein